MKSGEVRDVHWNGGNNGDWVEDDSGDILPVDDFADQYDSVYFTDTDEIELSDNLEDSGNLNVESDTAKAKANADHSNHHRMARAVAGVATAAVGMSNMPNTPSSSVERPLEYDLDTVSSRGYGELADVMPPQYDMNLPVMRGAYIAYLSSLLGQAKNALDGLYQTEVYQRDVAEYDRQVDEANENYQFQPRLTKALRAEMQIKRRISELERRINDLKRMDDATNNP